jgi:hypothetical protein
MNSNFRIAGNKHCALLFKKIAEDLWLEVGEG